MNLLIHYWLEKTAEEEPWDKENPKKKSSKLSPEQKAKAKARAKSAGRPYPNWVDNAWASKQAKENKGKMEGMRMGKHLSREGGMTQAGVEKYRRDNPGSKLKTAVTTKPSKLKPGSKAAKRRKSFCARMSGNPGPMKDEKGRPTRKALSLRKWNC